jgi:tetratricopeptide (TPR) repeat protein
MKNTLLENLQAFYQEDPDDPFNSYALAMEYAKTDPDKAGQFYRLLLKEHPSYLPTYYHAAAFFALQDQVERADEIYQKGIELALLQKNTKTHQELLRAYRNFLDEIDD